MVKERIQVHHPSSVVIVTSGDKICHAVYDEGFPRVAWRNHANFIGGNFEPGKDYSPRGLLEREVSEELSMPSTGQDKFAPEADILRARRAILLQAHSYGDFFITDPYIGQELVNGKVADNVVCFYHSEIPEDLMQHIEEALSSGKRMTSEGYLGVNPIDFLVNGKVPMAWSSPAMLSHFLRKEVANPHGAKAAFLGKTRETFADYLDDFEYMVPIE